MHYFSFNIPDWTLATAHLSLEEEGAYFRLCKHYYDTELPIPLETQSVIRRLRLGSYEKEVVSVLAEFFTKTEKGYVHGRCEAEIKEYKKNAKKNRVNGGKGGRPRKIKALPETQTKPSGFPDETQSEPTGNHNQEPLTNNNQPIKIVNPWPGLKSLDGIDFSKWPTLPSKSTMSQWLKVRQRKRATNSQIAMDDTLAQILKASEVEVTAEQCIALAVGKSWAGFEWGWVLNELKKNGRIERMGDLSVTPANLQRDLQDRSWAN